MGSKPFIVGNALTLGLCCTLSVLMKVADVVNSWCALVVIFVVLSEQNIFRIHNIQVSSNLEENMLVLICYAVIQGIRLLVQGPLI